MRKVVRLVGDNPIRPLRLSLGGLEEAEESCFEAVSSVFAVGSNFEVAVAFGMLDEVESVNVLLLWQAEMGIRMCCLQNDSSGGLQLPIQV
jgi:hypothetical protein